MTPTTRKLLLWGSLLTAFFLIGFIPSYLRASRLDGQLQAANRRIVALELRDGISYVYFEATRKNYGLAAAAASEFFNKAGQALAHADDVRFTAALRRILESRDAVIAGLAKGEAAVLGPLQTLYVDLRNATAP